MSSRPSAAAVRETQALLSAGSVAGLDDDELLRRFTARRDVVAEVAFAALMARHGPLVLAVCRRALADPHDADDAFQATFLVLARRAGAVRGATLGPWLYGVARRVARRLQADAQRSRQRDIAPLRLVAQPVAEDATAAAERAELAAVVDEELARLSERERAPLVLCDLGGLTHEQAAERLGWPVGTVKSRQARGRDRLRHRLARRGVAPAAALALWESTASAAPGSRLVQSTVSAVQWFAVRGLAPPVGTVPAGAVAAAESIVRGMLMTKLKLMGVAAVLSLSALIGGVAARGQNAPTGLPAANSPTDRQPGQTTPPGPGSNSADRMHALEEKLDRLLRVLEHGGPRAYLSVAHEPVPAPPGEAEARGDAKGPTVIARLQHAPSLEGAVTLKEVFHGQPESVRLDALERRLSAVEQKLEQLWSRSQPSATSVTVPPPPSAPQPGPAAK